MQVSLAKVIQNAQIRKFPAGQIIIFQGEIPQNPYIIESGVVKIYDIDTKGNEKILHLLKTPAILPFTFYDYTEQPSEWFYAALTDCSVYSISGLILQHALYADTNLTIALMKNFGANVRQILIKLNSYGKSKAIDKVVSALYFILTSFGADSKNGWFALPFTVNYQFVADMTGLTRETATTALKEVESHRVIRHSGTASLDIHKNRLIILMKQLAIRA